MQWLWVWEINHFKEVPSVLLILPIAASISHTLLMFWSTYLFSPECEYFLYTLPRLLIIPLGSLFLAICPGSPGAIHDKLLFILSFMYSTIPLLDYIDAWCSGFSPGRYLFLQYCNTLISAVLIIVLFFNIYFCFALHMSECAWQWLHISLKLYYENCWELLCCIVNKCSCIIKPFHLPILGKSQGDISGE